MSKSVAIYSTPTCVYCKMTKEFFKKNNVEYKEYDVSKDQKKLEEMVDKSHQMGVPVIDIDGEIFVGYDEGALKKALGL